MDTSENTGSLTLAERPFEKACLSKDIRLKRLPVSKLPGHRRPDYRVELPDCKAAIVEVKEIDQNDEDKRQERELAAGRSVAFKNVPGRSGP